ncbi:MAG: GNAT family N-acetyltransferase [Clostridia bacterium]|nr:GNAT family N-acetyltransferase [Clostridia bacterium]
MEYYKTIVLRDGRTCIVRNGTEDDASAVLDNFILTHGQTDFLLTYPDEMSFTLEREREYLRKKTDSDREIELVAEIEGKIIGTAGIDALGCAEKTRHRASFGISVDKAYWGFGTGRALAFACVECAKAAGYTQIELDVVAKNECALALYESMGFVEYGRNPRGFLSRISGMQEVILMRLELDS